MKYRIVKLGNGEYQAQIKKFFFWQAILPFTLATVPVSIAIGHGFRELDEAEASLTKYLAGEEVIQSGEV